MTDTFQEKYKTGTLIVFDEERKICPCTVYLSNSTFRV